MTTTNQRLAALATGQLGLFSREQANAIGVTDRQLRSRVSSGTLITTGPHSFRLPGAPITAESDLLALMLDIGDPVFAAGETAAALHGFDGFGLSAPFDLVVPRERNVRRLGHRVHSTSHLDPIDRAHVGRFRCTSPVRTLVDLARTHDHEQLMVAFDSGLRDGRFNESLVHRRIVALRTSGRFGIPKLLEAIEEHEIGRGAHSFLERRFMALIHSAGIPVPTTQEVLTRAANRLVRVDFVFPGTNVIVETLGYRYHRTTSQITRDAERMNALTHAGWAVYQFTYEQVIDDPVGVVDTLRTALRTARPRPISESV
jgi:hypothetical protein